MHGAGGGLRLARARVKMSSAHSGVVPRIVAVDAAMKQNRLLGIEEWSLDRIPDSEYDEVAPKARLDSG